ncbi:hypothetical protein J6590_047640 [Homalodisca vitripennis]|nr:hypothetical protein J6590_047640 [Homalodisca vitripennis]
MHEAICTAYTRTSTGLPTHLRYRTVLSHLPSSHLQITPRDKNYLNNQRGDHWVYEEMRAFTAANNALTVCELRATAGYCAGIRSAR